MVFIVKYRGNFINIRDFLNKHPGGKKILDKFEGLDIDEKFIKYEHSKSAEYLLLDYKFQGDLKNEEIESLEVNKITEIFENKVI